jgi:hypothetical protein
MKKAHIYTKDFDDYGNLIRRFAYHKIYVNNDSEFDKKAFAEENEFGIYKFSGIQNNFSIYFDGYLEENAYDLHNNLTISTYLEFSSNKKSIRKSCNFYDNAGRLVRQDYSVDFINVMKEAKEDYSNSRQICYEYDEQGHLKKEYTIYIPYKY